jgi:hypothetical protein
MVALVSIAACSSSPRRASGQTSCGSLYTLTASGKVSYLGGCAGALTTVPLGQLTLAKGQSFTLLGATTQGGTPILATPISSNPDVVKLLDMSQNGADLHYRAVGVGEATLSVSAVVCNGGPLDPSAPTVPGGARQRICPVLTVHVTH